MAKISVIIPVFNVEKFVEQCVTSVINQTFEDIEIICINDGSTDESAKILDDLASRDKRLKVVHKENTGYGNTMNLGLSMAQSEYISIVESDDFASENMLEELYDLAKEHDADFVKANYFELIGNENRYFENLEGMQYEVSGTASNFERLFYIGASIWSGLYKKTMLLENDVRFNETPGASFQDTSFHFKVLLSAQKVVLSKNAYIFYRRDNPSSSVYADHKYEYLIGEYEEIDRYMAKHNTPNFLRKHIHHMEFKVFTRQFRQIADPYKFAFLQRVRRRYLENAQCELDLELLSEKDKDELYTMINSPDQYLKRIADFADERLHVNSMSVFSLNCDAYVRGCLAFIQDARDIYIYGAGKVSEDVYEFLKKTGLEHKVIAYIISEYSSSQRFKNGVKIVTLDQLTEVDKKGLILVSTSDQHQYEILRNLKTHECLKVISMNSELRHAIYLSDN